MADIVVKFKEAPEDIFSLFEKIKNEFKVRVTGFEQVKGEENEYKIRIYGLKLEQCGKLRKFLSERCGPNNSSGNGTSTEVIKFSNLSNNKIWPDVLEMIGTIFSGVGSPLTVFFTALAISGTVAAVIPYIVLAIAIIGVVALAVSKFLKSRSGA